MFATLQPIVRPGHPPQAAAMGGMVAADALEQLAALSVTIHAERDEEIVAQGDPAGYCYRVASGCLRTVRLLEDGRRQVGEFLFAGDLFGWEALDAHEFAVEAVSPAVLRRLPCRGLESLIERDLAFGRRLHALAAGQLRASRERLLLLGRKSASERIASFLVEMAERMQPDGEPRLELPMSRSDMADYLGLTIETVCRGLTQLRRDGTIAVERSQVAILDRRALRAATCTLLH